MRHPYRAKISSGSGRIWSGGIMTPPDLQKIGNNAYRFINAVSDFATHSEPLRRTANYNESLFARTVDGNPLIDKAYQLVKAA